MSSSPASLSPSSSLPRSPARRSPGPRRRRASSSHRQPPRREVRSLRAPELGGFREDLRRAFHLRGVFAASQAVARKVAPAAEWSEGRRPCTCSGHRTERSQLPGGGGARTRTAPGQAASAIWPPAASAVQRIGPRSLLVRLRPQQAEKNALALGAQSRRRTDARWQTWRCWPSERSRRRTDEPLAHQVLGGARFSPVGGATGALAEHRRCSCASRSGRRVCLHLFSSLAHQSKCHSPGARTAAAAAGL